ncbi:MAG: helix-turn-helix domain-containing protein [Chitinophagales bacterium]
MKTAPIEIKKFNLDPAFYNLHKEGLTEADFGLDNSKELIGKGFGLYSTTNLKKSRIGPIKTQFFRIALIRAGNVNLDIGLETYYPIRDSIVFGFPGQVFSLYDQGDDFLAYYMLFTDEFIADSLLLKNIKEQFPFLSYSGVQSFQLTREEACEIENFIMKINNEIKNKRNDIIPVIQLYIQLILIQANRSYEYQFSKQDALTGNNALFKKFIKLVNQHFLSVRKVADYAGMLHVSSDHLNRIIKFHSQKTAHELIDEMILTEAKAYLLHTELSIAEIAYKLDFSDPSHFNKFFKKLTDHTPLQYRSKT